MQNRIKRLWALFMVLALSVALLGCNVKVTSQNGTESPQDAELMITVGLPSNAKVTDYKDNAFTAWLEDQCNVQLVFQEIALLDGAVYSYSSLINHMKDADILWNYNIDAGTSAAYGRDGYIADLRSYYEDREGASKIFWERLNTLAPDQQAQVLNRITDPVTGTMYGVPTVETSMTDGIHGIAWINRRWLDKLSLDIPTTTDELYNVLVAFKNNDCNGNGDPTDEIPLFGSENAGTEASVISWLINMHMYYNRDALWQDYDGDGRLEAAYTQDAYREALKFINKLYKEKLLTSLLFMASSGDMKGITTPGSNTALCGIFLGDLVSHTTYGSPVMQEYEAMPTFGCATREPVSCSVNCFITQKAVQRGVADRCFQLMMAMWSWEGSMRMRYGEYRVDWTDPSADGTCAYGIAPVFKLLDDPFMKQSSATWGKIGGTLLQYADGENAQTSADTPQWELTVARLRGKAWEYYNQAEANNNPRYLKDPFTEAFYLTGEEQRELGAAESNLGKVMHTYLKLFVTGEKNIDIHKDAHWQQFLEELEREGYEKVQAAYQICYDRQK